VSFSELENDTLSLNQVELNEIKINENNYMQMSKVPIISGYAFI
jgi:hypothetical protein